MSLPSFLVTCAALWCCTTVAVASEPATGTFTATRSCEAFQSFRKGTNPGDVRTSPGTAYSVREVNGPDRRWLRVDVGGTARWVSADCGTASVEAASASPRTSGGQCNIAGEFDSYVLAVSWQPGFCEHVKYNGTKPECDRLADRRLVVNHLTLHGLWPNRQSCGTRYGACAGPALDLRPDTLALVRPWMPNFQYEQAFGRHEWNKHGTCTAMDDDTYFRRAVTAVKTLDASAPGRYIATNAGRAISRKVFYERVVADTGRPLAVNAITLLCTNKQLFEVRVKLPVDFQEGASLDQLLGPSLPATRPADPKECRGDEILVEAGGR
ncbi:MAG: ribonuclease I [Rhizobacter sp.]